MSDREIAALAFFFAFTVNTLLFFLNGREFGLTRWRAVQGAAVVSFAGVAVAYVLTKWIVG